MNTTMGEVVVFDENDVRSFGEHISHILYITEGSWMVVGNGLITVTLLCHKTMQKNRMATMVALAIGDGLYGVGIFTGGIRRLHLVITRTDRVLMSAWECMLKFPTIFYIAGSQMTALAMVLISVDRYIAVAHPLYYLGLNDKRYSRTLMLAVVAFGVATSALAVAGSYWGWGDATTHQVKWSALCLSTWAVPKWYATGYTTLVAVGGYASIGIYGMVLRAYRKYVQKSADDRRSNVMKIKMERQRRLTVTMAFVTLMTLFFHSLPYTIILATTVLKLKSDFVGVLNPFLWCLVCFNSLANIFVYIKRHADIRAAMRDVVHLRFRSATVHPTTTSVHSSRPIVVVPMSAKMETKF